MHTIISNIKSSVPKFKRYSTKTLPNIQANQSRKNISALAVTVFRKGTSLKQIIGTNTIHNSEKLITTKNNSHAGKCAPCNLTRCLCCQQLISINQTNKKFKIYHRVNFKSSFVIYLLECYIWNIQYVGKPETPFNIRLNNHRKDVKIPNATPACKHAQSWL